MVLGLKTCLKNGCIHRTEQCLWVENLIANEFVLRVHRCGSVRTRILPMCRHLLIKFT